MSPSVQYLKEQPGKEKQNKKNQTETKFILKREIKIGKKIMGMLTCSY